MSKGIAIIYQEDGAVRINTGEPVVGFTAVVQNALTNLISDAGRDPIFPNRGTDLMKAALTGLVRDDRSASHQANFAAADTLFFSRETDVAVSNDKLDDIRLVVADLNIQRLVLDSTFVSIDGRVVSFPITHSS